MRTLYLRLALALLLQVSLAAWKDRKGQTSMAPLSPGVEAPSVKESLGISSPELGESTNASRNKNDSTATAEAPHAGQRLSFHQVGGRCPNQLPKE